MAKQILQLNSARGFSLIELLVALVIVMVGLLALIQTVIMAIQTNLQNELRVRGVQILEQQLAQEKSLPFDNITSTGTKALVVSTPVRNTFKNYSVNLSIDSISDDTKRINYGVRWIYKGNKYEHVVASIVTRKTVK